MASNTSVALRLEPNQRMYKLTLNAWIDEEETHKDLQSYQRRDVNASLAAVKVGTIIVHNTDKESAAPRIPLAQRMGLLTKNMFSPLKLETMFEPPSAEEQRFRQRPESPPAWNLDEQKPFTFSSDPPEQQDFRFTFHPPQVPKLPAECPATPDQDANRSKLRLFQFNYDAYTREHLSALIEAIPLDPSSSPDDAIFSRKRDGDEESPIFRPPKRIKISSKEDEDGPTRPPKYGRLLTRVSRTPYRTPARSLVMDAIKSAKVQTRISPTAYRSTASSTINASESSRSLTGEELALKMRQVALVSQEEADEGPSQRPQTRYTPSIKHTSHAAIQQRFPSTTTNMTHIGPTDISPLPDQIGVMQFDRTALRWVRKAGEESDDPFRDLESVRDVQVQKQIEISLDPDEQHPIQVLTGLDDEDPVADSPESSPGMQMLPLPTVQHSTAMGLPGMVTPIANRFSSKTAPTPIRSALKGANAATPLGNRIGEPGSSTGKLRSVSFSDGRRHGRIRGLHPEEDEETSMESSAVAGPSGLGERNSILPSLRTKRITEMLDDLDNLSQEDEDPTPCKSSHQQRSMVGSQLGSSASLHTKNSFSMRSTPNRSMRAGDATFLTECSFGVAHDKLLQAITDVQPFEPHWEELAAIDLSGKVLDSVARLKEFMPKLEELALNDNQISWLSGVPAGVRLLSAASNLLTGLTSYVHLSRLECLDISDNQIESLLQLECLHRLRELRADRNQIGSLGGVGKLVKLKKLSLSGNCLTHADLFDVTWDELEYLDLSKNRLEVVRGLDRLRSVSHVNLDDNVLTGLELGGPMRSLRILRLSDNRLTGTLDVRKMSQLRVLYADRNRLSGFGHGETLTRLERLSVRFQSGEGLNGGIGNDLGSWCLDAPCYNLQYLELADCKLTKVPKALGEMAPNVRVLNLNHNFMDSLEGVESMRRLRKLSVIGSRIRTSKGLLRAVRGMDELEVADFRMNPCTVSWYVPLLEDGGALDGGDLDAKFRRRLPDELYAGRLVYRGLMMKACGKLKMLDGVMIGTGERTKAYALLERAASGGGVER
ncbi:hypothetical protein PIIN_07266 [Serendipita indica DSM 11827]|uniref:L domain-like protein n=1 Tax=Serendipita indica (strain DSM 11827) TaxID=1109443 RepID=G4TPR8_SERID|nr:hypothetical protein PIIN_07266 [Serendipita indica DSM 11827]